MTGMPAIAGALMNENDIRELKNVLRARIEFLLVMIDENASSSVAGSGQLPKNMFAPALRTSGNAIADHAIEQAQRELTQLTRNLSWLESDRAGQCDHCGCDIPLERLKRLPTTRACAQCA